MKFKKVKLSKKQKISILVALAVVVGGGFTISKINVNNNKEMEASGPMIDLYTIPGKEKVFIKGKIVPKQSKSFASPADGSEVDKINVKDGQDVKKGDLLFTTKNKEVVNEINALNTQIASKQKAKAAEQDEEIKKQIDIEIAELNGQVKALGSKAYSSYTAPFAGRVYITENVEAAEGAVSNVMVLETTDYYLNGSVNEFDLVKLKKDQEIDVTVLASKAKCVGKIVSIGDRPEAGAADPMGYGGGQDVASFPVKIEVEDQKDLRNGFNVQMVAEFGASENKVPVSAIKEEAGKKYVLKVVDDIPTKAEVKVKSSDEKISIVTEGLNENDVIIRDANDPSIIEGKNIYEASK